MEAHSLTPSTIKVAAQHLRTALERAVANRILDRNPAKVVRLPRRNPTRHTPMSQDEMRRFVHSALMPSGLGGFWWYGPMIAVGVLTGLRAGELRGLQWGNIEIGDDLGADIAGVIEVTQQIATIEKKLVFSPPKSTAGTRMLPIGPEVAMILDAQKQRLERHALRRGTRSWKENDLVFPAQAGSPACPNNMRRTCRRVAEAAGVEPAPRMIGLRHTYASVMVDSGVPPHVVAELLGHADVRLTVNTYNNMTPPAQREAVAALRRALGEKGLGWG